MNELSRNDPFMFPIGLLQKTILNFLINKAMEEDMVSLREQIFCSFVPSLNSSPVNDKSIFCHRL